jgi:4-diphosphocytidyl-2C-methyl-D-erythritol kinase
VLKAIENDFELSDKHCEKIISLLNEIGSERAFLCGSGPTVCGLFTDTEKAKAASEKITQKHFICRVN